MDTPGNRRARDGEVYVALADRKPAFPAVIDDKRWNGFVRPLFTRDTAEVIAAWLNLPHASDPVVGNYRAVFDDDVLIVADTYAGHTYRFEPDADRRYAIGAGEWIWELGTPEPDVAAETALLADTDRLTPEDGEILVTMNLTGSDPVFPATIDPDAGWSRANKPRFRPAVAAVVVAWLNDTERRHPGGPMAYWDDGTIVLVDWLSAAEDGYLPTRVVRDPDGCYMVDTDFEWERPADGNRQ
ncbi:hypothetical protein [Amycolatopsis sp. H20-H5]|uniref:hypothetical protein n=1 Tax=Amycolatopsis sp. H20-H5 TaxID=3046309 RepID=UPI002DB77446|nr:hypothetical protein [Amycolatopsis sp. H20-H5]MEC3974339.1 hypothetical protein [Amycolatopsis sp. H20-H5]